MVLHEILLTFYFAEVCRRQRILRFHIQFLPKSSSGVQAGKLSLTDLN